MEKHTQRGGTTGWIVAIIVIAIIISIILARGDTEEPNTTVTSTPEVTLYTPTLTLRNVSTTQPLSPGVIIVHEENVSFDFSGSQAHPSLELLAEIGAPDAFRTFAAESPGVVDTFLIESPLEPGDVISPTLNSYENQNLVITVLQMAVGSNDGYAIAEISLDSLDRGISTTFVAENHDAGFEENTELLSGFAGGQPDPSRGQENLENGTPTDPQGRVTDHPQLTSPLLEIDVIIQ